MDERGSITLPASPVGQGPALEAHDLSVLSADRVLLREVSLTLARGELVALIGPSGAGKTTLLRALAGSGPLNAGSIDLGEPHQVDGAERRYGIGYVPSEDPLHDELSVTEELVFAAALRAPADVPVQELHATVERVIEELSLGGRADARVGVLSKGERRRVSLGVELVGRPDVLLLDEPGSGLDAVLERRTMLLLRGVADRGQAVLAATHATASLALCDRVAAMSSGGRLAYIGTMDELFSHFGVTSIEQIYEQLDDVGVRESAAADGVDFDAAEAAPVRESPVRRAASHGRPARFSRQLSVLTERAALCRIRDLRALAVLLGQAPIIGLAIGLVIPHSAVSNQTLGPYFSLLIDFALMTACVWLGTIAACRDIVVELPSIRQEHAIGLRLDAYLIAKCLTLMPVVLIQTALMAVVVALIQSTPDAAGMTLACMVTGVASAGLALWLSALSRNSDIAIGCTPLVIIPQLLLSGALIPTATLPAFFRVISDVTVGRWSFDAIGSALHLNQTVGSSLSDVTGLGATSFASHPVGPDLLMLVLGAAALVLCSQFLANRIRN